MFVWSSFQPHGGNASATPSALVRSFLPMLLDLYRHRAVSLLSPLAPLDNECPKTMAQRQLGSKGTDVSSHVLWSANMMVLHISS